MPASLKTHRTLLLLACGLFAGSLLVAGCDSDAPDPDPDPPDAHGLAYAQSNRGPAITQNALVEALEAAPSASVVAEIFHAGAAAQVGLGLLPTQLVLFGNPALGTPLMQADQRAGIDLPQKMLIQQDRSAAVYVSYNTTDYLAARHDVGGAETLDQIAEALQMFAERASNGDVQRSSAQDVQAGEGLVEVESEFSADSTFARLENTIENSGQLAIATRLDHAANADSVGMELRPTRLLVFGSPVLGTPLMQQEQSAGIDLPQKALVYEDAEGAVFLVYNDPAYVAARHGIEGQDDVIDQIRDVLEALAEQATEAADG